ncbi:MAG: glycosyltransferase family 4 protein [Planctomycetota bacterium]|nr:glycosyltransferase family 4 protein [Planctomycetota bacterium]
MSARRRFVHVFATFGPGGPQVRAAQLIRHLGPDVEHVIQAVDGVTDAAALLDPDARVTIAPPPPRRGFFRTRRAEAAWLREQQPDLVLTYNWGAIEGLAAAKQLGLPLIHHEDGFGPDEVHKRLPRRNWTRRWLLRDVPVVVPSQGLREIARVEWGVDAEHLVNGVDLERFAPVGAEPDELVIGSVGGLRPEKDYATLLQAVARMQHPAQVRVVGSGALEVDLRAEAARLGLVDRVTFVGFVSDTAAHYRDFTVFAMSSQTEQMPIALVEAMACGLPVVATDVGDVRVVVSEPNRPLVAPPGDPLALARALDQLAADPALRRRLGDANRAKAAELYEARTCLERFCAAYERAAR